VSLADEKVLLGEARADQSYLAADKILDAARATGADAIHPGYGFLSENADFAERCEASGIAFIGPTPAQMRAFGLKHRARALAMEADVPQPAAPVVPDGGTAKAEPAAPAEKTVSTEQKIGVGAAVGTGAAVLGPLAGIWRDNKDVLTDPAFLILLAVVAVVAGFLVWKRPKTVEQQA
jgi:acetyl/propionyl-CoA carboxylase alpha subunit